MAAVFDISEEEIVDTSSPDNVEGWDSLRHMTLVLALEEEFNVELLDAEVHEMLNFLLIENIIDRKL
jgi:acyl carrier protein